MAVGLVVDYMVHIVHYFLHQVSLLWVSDATVLVLGRTLLPSCSFVHVLTPGVDRNRAVKAPSIDSKSNNGFLLL